MESGNNKNKKGQSSATGKRRFQGIMAFTIIIMAIVPPWPIVPSVGVAIVVRAWALQCCVLTTTTSNQKKTVQKG